MAAITTKKHTATSAQAATKNIVAQFHAADSAVAEIRVSVFDFNAREGWLAMGYKSFHQWADACLPWEKSRCYNLLDEAEVEQKVISGATGSPVDGVIPARHLTSLVKVDPDSQQRVYQQAVDLANVGHDGETMPPKQRDVDKAIRTYKEAQPTTDARGSSLSNETLDEVMDAANGFDAVLGILASLKTKLAALAKSPAGELLAGELDSINRHRGDIYRLVRFCRPYAECIYCGGSGAKNGRKCRGCKGRRWLNEISIKSAPPPKETQPDDDNDSAGAETVPASV